MLYLFFSVAGIFIFYSKERRAGEQKNYRASKKTAWQMEKLRSEQQMETENCFSIDDKMQKYMFMLRERLVEKPYKIIRLEKTSFHLLETTVVLQVFQWLA